MAYLWACFYMWFLFMQYLWRNLKWLSTIYIPDSFSKKSLIYAIISPKSNDWQRRVCPYLLPHLCIVSHDDRFARKDLCAQSSKALLQIYLKLTPADKPINICAVARQEQYCVADTWSSPGLSPAGPSYGEWLVSSL